MSYFAKILRVIWQYSIMHALILTTISLPTKFEMPSFIYCKDMIMSPKFRNMSCDHDQFAGGWSSQG